MWMFVSISRPANQNLLRTDMQLDENILSKDEYAKALKGKRHFKDEAF